MSDFQLCYSDESNKMMKMDEGDNGSSSIIKTSSPLFSISECLLRIFEYLKEDPNSLFSILLVNRTWCRVAVPILWSRPFELLKNRKNNYHIMTTYFQCLEDDQKFPLQLLKESSPSFDYPIFLRHLCCNTMMIVIELWFDNFLSNGIKSDEEETCLRLLVRQFLKLIMSKTPSLETLILWKNSLNGYNIILAESLTNCNPNTLTCLNGLSVLKLDGNYNDLDLYLLTKKCSKLKKIIINCEINSNGLNLLNNLIRVQNCLKVFKLGFKPENNLFTNKVKLGLLDSLSLHQNTLGVIEFNRCNFIDCVTVEPLKHIKNLKELIFWKCINLTPEKMFPLRDLNFNELEKLEIYVHPGISSDLIIKIIKSSNNKLKNLRLAGITPQNDLSKVLKVMGLHSKNLTDCRLVLKDGDIESFNNLLSFLDTSYNLEILYITFTDRQLPICNYEELTNHLPLNLKELQEEFFATTY
nr:8885_t:CDS:2 [Entrophospora candida]